MALAAVFIWPRGDFGNPQAPVSATARPPGSYSVPLACAAPAIVGINAVRVAEVVPNPLMEDAVFREFFGTKPRPGRHRRDTRVGIGVVLDSSGLICREPNHRATASWCNNKRTGLTRQRADGMAGQRCDQAAGVAGKLNSERPRKAESAASFLQPGNALSVHAPLVLRPAPEPWRFRQG